MRKKESYPAYRRTPAGEDRAGARPRGNERVIVAFEDQGPKPRSTQGNYVV